MEPLEFIQKTGVSYKELAEICAVEYVTVCRWMNHDRRPSSTVKALLLLYYESKHVAA